MHTIVPLFISWKIKPYWGIRISEQNIFLFEMDFISTIKFSLNAQYGLFPTSTHLFHFLSDKKLLEKYPCKLLSGQEPVEIKKGQLMQNRISIKTATNTFNFGIIHRNQTENIIQIMEQSFKYVSVIKSLK